MSDELNMEAERAEFEAWASHSGPHITLCHVFSFSPDVNGGRYHDGTTELCWRAWLAARRTAPVSAPMGQELSPLPEPDADLLGDGEYPVWNKAQVEQAQSDAIAPYAERIRQLERELAETKANLHTAVQEAWKTHADLSKRELAERKTASIDSDPTFSEVLARFLDEAEASNIAGYDMARYQKARSNLIAYIDGRTAGTAPEGYVIVPKEATEAMVHAAQDLPPPRMFGLVYRTMIAAAPTPMNSGKEEA